jgi:hypothetical protein
MKAYNLHPRNGELYLGEVGARGAVHTLTVIKSTIAWDGEGVDYTTGVITPGTPEGSWLVRVIGHVKSDGPVGVRAWGRILLPNADIIDDLLIRVPDGITLKVINDGSHFITFGPTRVSRCYYGDGYIKGGRGEVLDRQSYNDVSI